VTTDITPADRIALLISLALAGVALASMAVLPAWSVELTVLGSPLAVGLSGQTLLALLLATLVAAGTEGIIRSTPELARVDVRYTATFWILPVLVTLAAATAVPGQFGNVATWLGSLVLLGVLLGLVLVAEFGTARLDSPHYRTARVGLNLATYLAAFALYATIYGMHKRSLMSATAVLLVTFPLALELLRLTTKELATTWLFAGIVALVLGELTWAVNAWGLSSLAGGGFLLVAFYTLSGVAQQHLAGRLSGRIVLEFVTIAIVGLTVILLASRWPVG
jgi:hypothetical protein